MNLTEKQKITLKYHKHLEGNEEEGMMYYTLEDVNKCMDEYAQYIISQNIKDMKDNNIL